MKNKLKVIVLSCIFLAAFAAPAQDKPDKDKTAPVEPSGEGASSEASPPAAAEASAAPAESAAEVPAAKAAATSVTSTVDFSIQKILDGLKKLKDEVAQSEKRMDDIVSVVLSSAETKGSRIVLIHRTEMSPDFVLVGATFSLDGAPFYKKTDEDGLLLEQEVVLYDGAILPGKHSLSVSLVFRGHGFGIMSYLSKYKFKVRSKHSFEVKQGKGLELKVVCFEKGDINTKLEDRPAIKYVEKKIEME
jgi:hypothetical protein